MAVRSSPRWLSNSPARSQTRMFPAAPPVHRVGQLNSTCKLGDHFLLSHGLGAALQRPWAAPSPGCEGKTRPVSALSPVPPPWGGHHTHGGAAGAAVLGLKNLIGAESGCSTRHRDLLAASSLYFRPQTQTSDHPSPSESEGGIPIAAVRPRSKEVVHSGT